MLVNTTAPRGFSDGHYINPERARRSSRSRNFAFGALRATADARASRLADSRAERVDRLGRRNWCVVSSAPSGRGCLDLRRSSAARTEPADEVQAAPASRALRLRMPRTGSDRGNKRGIVLGCVGVEHGSPCACNDHHGRVSGIHGVVDIELRPHAAMGARVHTADRRVKIVLLP